MHVVLLACRNTLSGVCMISRIHTVSGFVMSPHLQKESFSSRKGKGVNYRKRQVALFESWYKGKHSFEKSEPPDVWSWLRTAWSPVQKGMQVYRLAAWWLRLGHLWLICVTQLKGAKAHSFGFSSWNGGHWGEEGDRWIWGRNWSGSLTKTEDIVK